MTENKNKPNAASVEAHLSAMADEARRRDCRELIALMSRVSKAQPKMWGTSIVGFGSYHYKYESGREGDSCIAGFSSRKGDISIYLMAGTEQHQALLGRLGKHKAGKGCLYVRSLADVDTNVLEELITASIAEVKRRYP